ncbi:MAG: glycosyltransferase family 9 protein [Citricoccus sp.]|nr:glycosyltransferase family 9 protein [Citricoccus sp. WCRC_4]
MHTDAPEPYTADWLASTAGGGDRTRAHAADQAGLPRLHRDDVVVLRALGLGDALTGVAALRGVRRLAPGRRLVLAAPGATGSLLRGLGVVDEVLPMPGLVPFPPVPAGMTVVNLHGRGPASHRLLQDTRPRRLVAFASGEAHHAGPAWHAEEHEVDRWCRLVRDAGGECSRADLRLRPRSEADAARARHAGSAPVVLHPGAASPARHWPAGRWRRVAAALAADGHAVVVTGSHTEAPLGRTVSGGLAGVEDQTGRHTLGGLSALIRDAALVLSADTGVAHLATGWCVPSVVLFGPVPPARWGPAVDPDLHEVLWHGDPEAGVWGDPHGDRLDPLLDQVTVEEVLAAAGRQLDRRLLSGRTHREP